MNAFAKMARELDSLSDGQKRLGEYLLSDGSALLVSTAREVAAIARPGVIPNG
ncbi:MAG: hypothetical protein ACREQW_20085 [Candidatus Binatia bacterium]